jgi:hypothetical protein
MNNYFANYKCFSKNKQRIAIFGRETKSGKLELFEVYCSKNDKFKKFIAKEVYKAWINSNIEVLKVEIKLNEINYNPRLHYINIKKGDTAKFTFNTYCNDNFYHQYEGVARYEEKYLYKKGQPKIVLKSKRLNKMDATY